MSRRGLGKALAVVVVLAAALGTNDSVAVTGTVSSERDRVIATSIEALTS